MTLRCYPTIMSAKFRRNKTTNAHSNTYIYLPISPNAKSAKRRTESVDLGFCNKKDKKLLKMQRIKYEKKIQLSLQRLAWRTWRELMASDAINLMASENEMISSRYDDDISNQQKLVMYHCKTKTKVSLTYHYVSDELCDHSLCFMFANESEGSNTFCD